jgi:hypothetical protein
MSSPFSSPVALTSIERLYFFDSSNSFPNRITCRLMVDQAIDPAAAKEACYWVALRHPVLGCTIERIGRKLCWVQDPAVFTNRIPADAPTSPFETNQSSHWFQFQNFDSEPDTSPNFLELLSARDFYRPCMVIRQWPQWPGIASSNPPQNLVSEVWFSTHHCFFDGAGGIQIMSDWVQIYENLISGHEPNEGLPEIDHQRFNFRNRLGLSRWKFLRMLPFQAIGLFGAAKFVLRRSIQGPQRGLNPGDLDQVPVGPSMVGAWLSADELLAVEQWSQAGNFNSNAKFLGDLFGTLQTWHLNQNQAADPGEWIRIILPINLREIGDRRMSAANRSSLIQMDRRNLHAVTKVDLYRSIQREIGIVLRFQLDRMFLSMIRLIGINERILKRVVRNQKPRGIAAFTNLGRPFRRIERRLNINNSGNQQGLLNIREFDFLAPLRYGTPLNFSLAQFHGRLRLTLHYDASVFSGIEADRLLRDYLDAIRTPPESCDS